MLSEKQETPLEPFSQKYSWLHLNTETTDENYLFSQDSLPPEPIRGLEFIESFFAFN